METQFIKSKKAYLNILEEIVASGLIAGCYQIQFPPNKKEYFAFVKMSEAGELNLDTQFVVDIE